MIAFILISCSRLARIHGSPVGKGSSDALFLKQPTLNLEHVRRKNLIFCSGQELIIMVNDKFYKVLVLYICELNFHSSTMKKDIQ